MVLGAEHRNINTPIYVQRRYYGALHLEFCGGGSTNIEVLCTYLMLPMGVFRLPKSQASKKQLLKRCLEF